MLVLMQLYANGQDDVHAYTHLNRAWLEAPAAAPASTGAPSSTPAVLHRSDD
jgi:hypothetical protein